MKPPPFDYVAPASLDDVVSVLASEPDAKLIAGGQSLMPLINMRMARPEILVGLEKVPGLDDLRLDGGGFLNIGAMTRHRALERDAVVAEYAPVLSDVVRHVGHVAIRNRGTVGGSVAHADPAAELPLAMLALDAEFVAAGPAGERTIPCDAFFRGFLTTALQPDEVLVRIRVPVGRLQRGFGFAEMARRGGDFAIASVLVLVGVDSAGRVDDVRIVAGGVDKCPVRIAEAEASLIGCSAGDQGAIEHAAEAVADWIDPPFDIHGSTEYRCAIAAVLTSRALAQAMSRALEGAAV